MPKNENFDFKHKSPIEIDRTDTKESASVNSQVNVVGTEEEIYKDSKRDTHTEQQLIKPKAALRNKRVQLLLTESNHKKIKEYAAKSGTSVNDAINQIIENI